MPRQFSPSDRDTVHEFFASSSSVYKTVNCGPGVIIDVDAGFSSFTLLMERFGWYVAAMDTLNDRVFLTVMPVGEVTR